MYAVMEKVAERLDRACAPGDMLARLGSRTFAVLHPDLGADAAEVFAANIIEDLGESIELSQLGEVDLAPALGLRVAEPSERDAEILLRDALAAMGEAAGQEHPRLVVFDPRIPDQPRLRFELEQALRQGLLGAQFQLYYQPIVDLRSDKQVGMEALIRWHRPGHGLVAPLEFIEIAEHCGLIVPIGAWVLEQGLADLASVLSASPGVFMSLNLSPYQLTDRMLIDRFTEACSTAGVQPSSVCLELTETAMITARHDAASYDALTTLRSKGVRIAIDDFGIGYSALSYLTDLPVDIVKIDRSFVSRLGVISADVVLVEAVIRLSHELGLTVIAEGVETQEQLDVLRSLDADAAQGYLFARPAPLEVILSQTGSDN